MPWRISSVFAQIAFIRFCSAGINTWAACFFGGGSLDSFFCVIILPVASVNGCRWQRRWGQCPHTQPSRRRLSKLAEPV